MKIYDNQICDCGLRIDLNTMTIYAANGEARPMTHPCDVDLNVATTTPSLNGFCSACQRALALPFQTEVQ